MIPNYLPIYPPVGQELVVLPPGPLHDDAAGGEQVRGPADESLRLAVGRDDALNHAVYDDGVVCGVVRVRVRARVRVCGVAHWASRQ